MRKLKEIRKKIRRTRYYRMKRARERARACIRSALRPVFSLIIIANAAAAATAAATSHLFINQEQGATATATAVA